MRFDPRDRWGRIRVRWVSGLVTLAVVPLFVVLGSVPYQVLAEARLQHEVSDAIAAVETGAPPTDVAREERVRIRRGESSVGRPVTGRWTNHVALRFVSASAQADIHAFDRQPPSSPGADGCSLAVDDRVVVCRARGLDAEGSEVIAEAAAIRTVGLLWDHRAPLVAIVLQMVLLAVGLGLWLGRRTVRPIHRLRDEVVARASGPVSTEPIGVHGSDEVADLARAFNTLLVALQSQRQANMDFLAEVAHELKTPIATIQQFAELVRDLDEDDKFAKPLTAVESSCNRLNVRTMELLELARASAGLPQQQRVQTDVAALVQNLAATLHGPEIAVSSTPSAVAMLSQRYFEIALRNVLENALHQNATTIQVSVATSGDVIRVVVADDGPGISAEDAERVFERFRSDRPGGTGLGLAMTRAIARAHGGDAYVEHSDGGAIVVIEVPRTP